MSDKKSLDSLSITNWSAWITYYIVPASFIISLASIFVATAVVWFTVDSYVKTKEAETNVAYEKIDQQKFENAFKLFSIVGDNVRTNGAYSELAAIKELERYPKYHFI